MLAVLMLTAPAAGAQTGRPEIPTSEQPGLSEIAADIAGRAERSVEAVDTYFQRSPSEPQGGSTLDEEVRQYRVFARQLRDAMTVVRGAAALPGSANGATAFGVRFDDASTRVSDRELVDLAARSRLDRFIPVKNAPRCCDALTMDAAKAEHTLAVTLEEVWKGFGQAALTEAFTRMTAVYSQFEAKLLNGFPAMPWEYIVNFRGNRDGPSRHQLIWAHLSMGVEIDNEAAAGTSQAHPVLAVQAIGYNFYFFRGINYLGATALLTMNATAGGDRWRRGAALHVGNIASIGATRGNGHWLLFVASDRLSDKLVGALVRLR
jgi:hypothetical protein